MANSSIEHTQDKRSLLRAGARQVLHQQGIERTTIADIAQASGIPVGNVYYYYKTKDELIQAAVDSHAECLEEMLASLEAHRTPQARLKAMLRALSGNAELVARYGCPHGSLVSELNKRDDGIDRTAAKLMLIPIDWAEQQFQLMGRTDARELAVALIAAYQGIALLTNTLRDPQLMTTEANRLKRWIDSLT
jgi:AcrR family transcriptional regulator